MNRPKTWRHYFIYGASLLLAFHYAFIVYINSAYLSRFFSDEVIGLFYTGGAIVNLIGLLVIPILLRSIKAKTLFICGLIIEMITLLGMGLSSVPLLIGSLFIIHQGLPPLLLYCLDLIIEHTIKTEKITGTVRSNYLTSINIAFVLSPTIVGILVGAFSEQAIYIISALICFVLFLLMLSHHRGLGNTKLNHAPILGTLESFALNKDLRRIFFTGFLLHCFYAGMVIFTPIFLLETIGFSWETIGILFTIMLLPFVLFEAPLGRMFDKYHTEKETLIVGYLLMSLAAFLMFKTSTTNVVVWALFLFISRMGASFVEISTEYAFFKRVTDHDAGYIGIYRMTVPIAYLTLPVVFALVVKSFSVQYVYLLVSIIVLTGIPVAYRIGSKKNY